MKTVGVPFVWILNLIEFFDRLFRPAPKPTLKSEIFPTFENDNRELIRELAEREPRMVMKETTKFRPISHGDKIAFEVSDEFEPVFLNTPRNHSPEIRAPKGAALRKSVLFRTNRGEYMSAKVVGWESDGALILSRKNGPPFRRYLIATA